MSSWIRDQAVETFAPMLESLSAILDKAADHAGAGAQDLPAARLAPDMFDLAEQVQQACLHARHAVQRLSGEAPGEVEGPARTIAGLKAQLEATVTFVRSAAAADFAGAERRDCSIALPEGMGVIALDGEQYLRNWALPHFYFHLVTAYDILRHRGAPIGKRDYLSGLGRFIRPA